MNKNEAIQLKMFFFKYFFIKFKSILRKIRQPLLLNPCPWAR
jgi:hypothetical protein